MKKEYTAHVYLDDDENVKAMRQTAEAIGLNKHVRDLLASDDLFMKDMRSVMAIAELLGMDVMEELKKVLG